MSRIIAWAVLLVTVSLGLYVASFYATRVVLGSGYLCDEFFPWTFNPCNDVSGGIPRYYALQKGNVAYAAGISNGIQGFISAQDVSIHDTQEDFIGNYIDMADTVTGESAQIGFTEGILPNLQQRTTPIIYTEFQSACPSLGYNFAERSTPPGNPRYNEYFRVSWAGASGSCAQGGTVYIWQFGRGSNFATIDFAFMFGASVRFDATTELRDRKYMEPSGTQCFGGGYLCTPSQYGYDLFLWNQTYQGWFQWDTSRPTTIIENQIVQGYASGYFHNPVQQWYQFTTTSGWP